MPARPGATVARRSPRPRPPVLAEADAARRRRRALTMARASLGPGLDGILVVAKPAGPTSHDIVGARPPAGRHQARRATAARWTRSRRACCRSSSGTATRVVEYHLGDRKAYRATVCFGATSTTDDLEGELTPADGPGTDARAVEAALPAFAGTISQRPPAYSAIKVAGRRAYAMARAGETVELAAREVTIHELDARRLGRQRPGAADRRARVRARPGPTSGRWPATSARRSAAPPTSAP